MANKKTPPSDQVFADFEADILSSLMAVKPLGGTDGALTELIKHVVEKSMHGELSDHLAREAADPDKKYNKRNGKSTYRTTTFLTTTRPSAKYNRST